MCQASVRKVTENRRVSGVAVSATEGRRRMGRRVAGRALTQQVKAVKKSREKVRIFTPFKNHIKYWNDLNFRAKTRCLKITGKSLIQHCERSELRLHFEWTKVY